MVAILNTSGTAVVTYTYDAWGKLLTTSGTMASTLGAHNPLRYRGYVYDTELGLYYLQSRYYDPAIGRFINADSYTSTGQGLLGNNMFAYCRNSPVFRIDISGTYDLDCNDTDPIDDELVHEEGSLTGGNQSNHCRNPYGRSGGPEHQGKIKDIGADLESRGYNVDYEHKVDTSGGTKGTRYLDIYAENGSDAIGIQVGRSTRGGQPVSRERAAMNDIISSGIPVVFVAYR